MDERLAFGGGQKCRLRRFVENDAVVLASWFNNPELRRTLGRASGVTAEEERRHIRRFYRDGQAFPYAISTPIDEEIIGLVGLYAIRLDRRSAEMGVFITNAAYRGMGIGSEASQMILRWAFDELRLHRVSAVTRADNTAFLGLSACLGFHHEAVYRDYYYIDEKYVDAVGLAVLDHEFEQVMRPVAPKRNANEQSSHGQQLLG